MVFSINYTSRLFCVHPLYRNSPTLVVTWLFCVGELSVVSAPRPPCGCWRNSQPPLSVSHQGSRFNISPCRDVPSLSPPLSHWLAQNRRRPSSENPPSCPRLGAFGSRKGVCNALALVLKLRFLSLQCAIGPCHGRFPCRAELKHGGPGAVCRAREASDGSMFHPSFSEQSGRPRAVPGEMSVCTAEALNVGR